jgi:hypothetical protein
MDTSEHSAFVERSMDPAGPLPGSPVHVRNLAFTLLSAAVVILLLQHMQPVLLPLVLGALLFYALDPAVDRLQRLWQRVAFSVEPFHRPSACFWPSAAIPSATIKQCSPTWTPSRMRPTSSRLSSGCDCQASNCARVLATNRRLTALLLVPRVTTGAGTGSKLRAYWRRPRRASVRRRGGSGVRVGEGLKRR